MVYKNGDRYANACNKNQRNAVIYFECDPSNVKFTILFFRCKFLFNANVKKIKLRQHSE